jgi:hypothetical protein
LTDPPVAGRGTAPRVLNRQAINCSPVPKGKMFFFEKRTKKLLTN